MSDHNNPKPDRVRIKAGVVHAEGAPDKDYGEGKEAKKQAVHVAHADYQALQKAVGDLNEAVSVVQKNLSYDVRPYRTEKESNNSIKLAGLGAGGSLGFAALSSTLEGFAKIGGPISMGVFGGGVAAFTGYLLHTNSDKHMERLIRADYKGKHEAEIVLALEKGKTLILPVTPDNMAAVVKAYEAGTAYAKANGGEQYVAADLEKGVRKAMLQALSDNHVKDAEILTYENAYDRHGVRTPFTKEDIAQATPIRGGVDVKGEPSSGLSVGKIKPAEGVFKS